MTTNNKPSTGFWIIAVIAFLWNAYGVYAYLFEAFLNEKTKALLPPEQVEFIENTPAWVTAAFAIAVFAGLLGCLLLLMRRKFATPIFLISLLAVLVRSVYLLLMSNAIEVYGTALGIVLTATVIIVAIFLYMYSKKATAKGWMR